VAGSTPLIFLNKLMLTLTDAVSEVLSKLATTRTTPVGLALFSLTCLIAHRLHSIPPLTPRTTTWYDKPALTFADCLEAVPAAIWREQLFVQLASPLAPTLFRHAECEPLIQQLASTLRIG
jgi:hypothetical protein